MLTALGAIGQLWDAKKSADENTRLEYSAEAVEVLQRCGLPIPPHVLLQRDASDGVQKAAERAAAEHNSKVDGTDSTTSSCCAASSAGGDDFAPEDIEYLAAREPETDRVIVQDEPVSSSCSLRSIFFCKA